MALLNRRLIATRRAALGLSRHDVAQATGLATDAIKHIETSGTHDDLHLSAAVQLAAALGVAIADLLETSTPGPAASRGDVAVEALLADRRQPVSADELADALGWTLARTLSALRALERRLAGTGQALQHFALHRYALVSDATALTATQRRDAGRRRLRPTSAPHECCTGSSAGHFRTAGGTPTPMTSASIWRSSSASGSCTTPAVTCSSAAS